MDPSDSPVTGETNQRSKACDVVFGATSPVGLAVLRILSSRGRNLIASGRSPLVPPSIPTECTWFPFDFLTGFPSQISDPPPWRDRTVGTVYFLSHPTFKRDDPDPLSLLPALGRFCSLYEEIAPRLQQGSSLLFLLPDLDRTPISGYRSARIYLGALKGLIGDWKRALSPRGIGVGGLILAHVPGHKNPNMTHSILEKMGQSTLRGRLVDTDEATRLLLTLAQLSVSKTPWSGELFLTPDGPPVLFS